MKTSILTACIATILISSPVFAQTGGNVADETISGHRPASDQKRRLSALVCFQAGVKIIDEHGIENFTYGQDMLYGDMSDGSKLVVTGIDKNAGVACKIVEYDK